MVVLKAKQSFLMMQYSFITTSRCTAEHGPTDFLNCDNNGTQDEKLKIMIIKDCLQCTWQAVSYDHYFNVFILRSGVITIEKVRGTVFGFVEVKQGHRDKTIVHRQKRLFSFQNDHFLYFLTIKAL